MAEVAERNSCYSVPTSWNYEHSLPTSGIPFQLRHSAEEFGLLREHLEALKNDPAARLSILVLALYWHIYTQAAM